MYVYMCACVSLTGDLYSGHVGRVCVCVRVSLTGDLYSGHVCRDYVCIYVCVCFPDRRPVFGSYRQ